MIKFTNKQIQILTVIKKGNDDGTACSVYDLVDKVAYTCKRDAMRHSLKILIDDGYVEVKGLEVRSGKAIQTFIVTTKCSTVI